MKNYIKDNKITIHFDETPFVESFKILNKNTKKAQSYIERFKNSTNFDLYDCYRNPSERKYFIFYYWKKIAKHFGASVKIISYNCDFFTVAFEAEIDNQKYLFIATAYYNYAIVL